MKLYFEDFSESVLDTDNGQLPEIEREDMMLYLSECQPFVIHGMDAQRIEITTEERDKRIDIDLPFEVCSFELFDGSALMNAGAKDNHRRLQVTFIMVVDKVKGYDIFYLCEMENHKIPNLRVFGISLDKERDMGASMHKYLCTTVKECVALMNNKEYSEGSENCRRRMKISSREKLSRRVGKIIHIAGKQYISKNKPTILNRVDFSHRFLRRGHWRRIPEQTLGKNRDGKRTERGRTWVNNSEVGPKDKPLLNKIRVVGAR